VFVVDEGSIEVICVPWKINRRMRFGLLVDGAKSGTLRCGRRTEVHTVAGPHSVGVTSADRGTYEVDVEVPPGGRVSLACSADSAGLSAAQRSMITHVWDGPSPMIQWVIEDEDWPDDPSPTGWTWWFGVIHSQKALAQSPRPFDRFFYWLTIKHYVIWWLLSTAMFGSFLNSSLTLSDPWVYFSPLWSIVIVLNTALMILRAIARRRPEMGGDLNAPRGQLQSE
jgi:hypothetical protein